MNLKHCFLFMLFILLISACNLNSTYEGDIDFEQETWHMDSIAYFYFEAPAAAQDVEVKFRSTLDYPNYNLYVKMTLSDSNGVVLADKLLDYELYDEKTGKPMGKGNSIYQFNSIALPAYDFPYEGSYRVSLAQYMRFVELPGILSVGIRVKDVED
jgi:gliding motility-associated lipoprotein GldH